MKKILFLLLAVFTMSLFTGCETRTNDPAEIKKQLKKEAKEKGGGVLPDISELRRSNRQTYGIIRFLNDSNPAGEKQPIVISGKNINIKGIAVDRHQETLAAGVYIKAGDEFYKANYGEPSKVAVEKMGDAKYLRSGFTVNIPTGKLKKGINKLGVFVVSSDRETYYAQKNRIRIMVK